ncbi:MAG: DNA translocase FtsK [Verrucomicrobiales bacterium]
MESLKLSVTELTCACLDPAWRQRWLEGEKPSTKNFAPPGTVPVGGVDFHAIVAEFLAWLSLTDDTGSLADSEVLWQELHDRFAGKIIHRFATDGKVDTALNLSSALQTFCNRIASLRQDCVNFTKWSDIFAAQEYRVNSVALFTGKCRILVSGLIDGLRLHPQRGMEIVDFKLSRAANLHKDLTQLAIYFQLLRQTQPNLKFQACLEYYHPEFELVDASSDQLENIFQSVILPTLHELAGETQPRPAPPAPPSAKTEPPPSVHDQGAEIEACFQSFGLSVTVSDRIEAPQIVRYVLQPASGVKVVSLANRAADLQVRLKLNQPPRIEPDRSGVTIDLPKTAPDTVLWREAIEPCVGGPLQFPIGQGVDGQIVLADLSDSSTCHGLVAGASGSGKSEWLKSVVATLIFRSTPTTVRLALIDPKLLTFKSLERSPHLLRPLMTGIEEALHFLNSAVDEMERRYQILGTEHLSNLPERHAAGRIDIPFWVIIFDEFAELILAGRDEKKAFENAVSRLAAKGRAAGIHLLLATQRPDRTIVTGLIKSNLPMKICLRVTNATNSQIVLDEPGGERLLGRGDLLYDIGRGVHRAQGPFISNEEILDLIRAGHPESQ